MHNTTDHECSYKHCANPHEYKRTAETQLQDWENQIAALKEKGKDMVGDAKSEFDSMLTNLEESHQSFTAYLGELGDKAEDTWDELKGEAEQKWVAFSDTIQKTFSKYG